MLSILWRYDIRLIFSGLFVHWAETWDPQYNTDIFYNQNKYYRIKNGKLHISILIKKNKQRLWWCGLTQRGWLIPILNFKVRNTWRRMRATTVNTACDRIRAVPPPIPQEYNTSQDLAEGQKRGDKKKKKKGVAASYWFTSSSILGRNRLGWRVWEVWILYLQLLLSSLFSSFFLLSPQHWVYLSPIEIWTFVDYFILHFKETIFFFLWEKQFKYS